MDCTVYEWETGTASDDPVVVPLHERLHHLRRHLRLVFKAPSDTPFDDVIVRFQPRSTKP